MLWIAAGRTHSGRNPNSSPSKAAIYILQKLSPISVVYSDVCTRIANDALSTQCVENLEVAEHNVPDTTFIEHTLK